ncbi:MAG: PDZ domain-containing protein, partial [Oscillospiraceae bacterium]|nr:PDZ domain-containing protein [Oscillospiraceae bacterium]
MAEITSVIKNSPADKAGIQTGENLIAINQHNIH